MKKIFTLIGSFLLVAWCTIPSTAQSEFSRADDIAANFAETYDNVEELARKLTASLSSDQGKARVFFMWLANHVRYDCRKYHDNEPIRFSATTQQALTEKMNKWEADQIQKTIKAKRGVCADYSRVFKALCDQVGLEAIVISGNARDFHKPYRSTHDNPHAWNAVKIDDSWQLLDATWGAGYTDDQVRKFTRRVAPGFFFTPANWFSQDHLPDEEQWQLREAPLSKKDFADQPLINYGQTKYRIKDFAPKIMETGSKKNNREIWLEFEHAPEVLMVANRKGKPIKFQKTRKDDKVILSFSEPGSQSITVYGGNTSRKMDWLAMYPL